jgi:hypothetical protein
LGGDLSLDRLYWLEVLEKLSLEDFLWLGHSIKGGLT